MIRGSIVTVETGVTALLANHTEATNNATAQYSDVLRAISSLKRDIYRIASSPSMPTCDKKAPVDQFTQNHTLLPISETETMDWLSESTLSEQVQRNGANHCDRKEEKTSKGLNGFAGMMALPNFCGKRCHNLPIGKRGRFTRRFWKCFAIPFGYLLLCHHISSRRWSVGSLDRDVHTSEFQFTFLPRSFFTVQAVSITATRDPCGLSSLNVQFRPMVNNSSPIFNACRLGDIDAMKMLLQRRVASPHDVNEDGEDLILVNPELRLVITLLVLAYAFYR